MPLGDHLEELRKRLIRALIGLVPILLTALIFGQPLLGFLLKPLRQALLDAGQTPIPQATEVLETFGAYMKVSLIAAIMVGSPWLLYQVWLFVKPGLYDREKRFVYFLIPCSVVLTTGGLVFLFRVVMPILLAFFLEFGSQIGVEKPRLVDVPEGVTLPLVTVLDGDPKDPAVGAEWINRTLSERRVCIGVEADGTPRILSSPLQKTAGIRQDYRVSAYVSLLLSTSLGFAIAFQTPIVVLLLGWAGMIDQAFLSKYRKHAFFACALVSACLMPGDVPSMILMWGPLYGLYELGGLLLRFFPAKRIATGIAGKEPDGEADT